MHWRLTHSNKEIFYLFCCFLVSLMDKSQKKNSHCHLTVYFCVNGNESQVLEDASDAYSEFQSMDTRLLGATSFNFTKFNARLRLIEEKMK